MGKGLSKAYKAAEKFFSGPEMKKRFKSIVKVADMARKKVAQVAAKAKELLKAAERKAVELANVVKNAGKRVITQAF